MTLVLKNEEMEGLLSMPQLIEDMEQAFKELGEGIAVNRPRSRMYIPTQEPHTYYWFNNIAGIVPSYRAMALRIDSSLAREVVVEGKRREEYPGYYVGLVLLFDTETCELLAIMDDHYLSPMRVGATSGVAARYLARPDAQVLGLFGSGEQARAQLMAMAAVRKLREVKVYSPNPQHRRRFAQEMGPLVGLEVRPVDHPQEVVRGSDIVCTATNSSDPVFEGEWLEEGTHVSTIVGGDYRSKRDEIDKTTYLRSQVIVVNTRQQVEQDRQGNLYELLQEGKLKWDRLYELGELVTGKVQGRTRDSQITLCKNNHGMGIQFAVTARRIYQQAKEKGLGTQLPKELFLTKREGVWSP